MRNEPFPLDSDIGDAMQPEKRRKPRQPLKYDARIFSTDGTFSASCTIVDISETGARLALEQVEDVPEEFILSLTKSTRVWRCCAPVWRADDELGVKFKEPSKPSQREKKR